jgi:preprotein translocase subunit SecD
MTTIQTVSVIDAIQSLVPDAQVSVVGNDVNQITWNVPSVAPVTNEQILAEQARLEAQVPLNDCKAQAVALLQATDWTTIPDVANPSASNPYLMNQGAFIAWRSQVRALAVNPVANPVFPAQPTEEWSQT